MYIAVWCSFNACHFLNLFVCCAVIWSGLLCFLGLGSDKLFGLWVCLFPSGFSFWRLRFIWYDESWFWLRFIVQLGLCVPFFSREFMKWGGCLIRWVCWSVKLFEYWSLLIFLSSCVVGCVGVLGSDALVAFCFSLFYSWFGVINWMWKSLECTSGCSKGSALYMFLLLHGMDKEL